MEDKILTIPAVALRGMTILPGMVAHFDISRDKSLRAVEEAMKGDQKLFIVTQKDTEKEDPQGEDLYEVGLLAVVRQVVKLQKNIMRVLIEGIGRAEIYEYTQTADYMQARVIVYDQEDDEQLPEQAKSAMLLSVQETFAKYARVHGKIGQDVMRQVQEETDLLKLLDYVGNSLVISYKKKQKLLEAVTLTARYEAVLSSLLQETEILALKRDFQKKVQERVEKHQKEYVLREQLALIREELGETNTDSDAEEYEKKLKELQASKEVKDRIHKEIQRFKGISANSSESTVSRGYIETLLELPWEKESVDNKDLEQAKKILDEDHYGLDKVKERILEFLAVRNLTGKGESPIICLVGPPGTGKTLLAKAVAGEAGVPFFSISGSDFVEMFVGVGASRVRDLFEDAKKNAPCIVFIDEIDAVARRRGTGMGGGHDEREQTLNQMLVEMDGVGVNQGIIVMAATNRVDILDPAIMRPGRFDRKIVVGRPDVAGREEILQVHAKNKPLGDDVDLKQIAQTTAGFTGADLENLLNEAAILAAKESRAYIQQADIQKAFIKVGIGAEKHSRVISEKEKKITAYHESGHALLFHLLPDVGPVHTVSIIPTGAGAAGYTMPLPEKDEMFNSRGRMLQEIVVDLGGRVAEELVFDDITTGASQDIKQATKMARDMVTRYGMSENIGLICYKDDDDEVFIGRDLAHAHSYSEGIASAIDVEVKRIIDESYEKAKTIIAEHRDVLDRCAALLLEKEKITREEFEALFEA